MKITAITTQVKRAGRYSIFIDGKYALSLSDSALLESKIVTGMELSEAEKEALDQKATQDKIYGQVLRYLSLRPRSKWEIEMYLKRKKTSPPLVPTILNELSKYKYIDDLGFSRSYLNNALLLHPTSRRKLILELKQKHVSESIISEAMEELDEDSEVSALAEIITKKRRISRYQDDMKLMQYLSRQGFSYGDIKIAINKSLTD
jgi:regulatory protein